MPGIFKNKYPYTDFSQLNLDWFMKQFKALSDKVDLMTTGGYIEIDDIAETCTIHGDIVKTGIGKFVSSSSGLPIIYGSPYVLRRNTDVPPDHMNEWQVDTYDYDMETHIIIKFNYVDGEYSNVTIEWDV